VECQKWPYVNKYEVIFSVLVDYQLLFLSVSSNYVHI